MKISVIIPVYNEAHSIASVVSYLLKYGTTTICEIIVVDGGSSDDTINVAKLSGARVVTSPKRGRASQMNYGAEIASGEVLYFVHADSFPPKSFAVDILNSLDEGYKFGRFRTRFDSTNFLLKINAFFTRFDLFFCYGGDQSLFITTPLFNGIEGFDDRMKIMEDYDIVERAKEKAGYKIIQKDTLISARKYDTNSWWKVQQANYTVVRMFKNGASQDDMIGKYHSMLNYRQPVEPRFSISRK